MGSGYPYWLGLRMFNAGPGNTFGESIMMWCCVSCVYILAVNKVDPDYTVIQVVSDIALTRLY
jgi:hypothetical protein